MKSSLKIMAGIGLGLAALVGGSVAALAAQGASAAELRASGQVGEQADGYLGLVDTAAAGVRAQVDAINIQRRAQYTQLAARRSATIEEVAAATACEIFSNSVGPGQYYRLADGVWRRRNGSEPVPRPDHCG